MENGKSMLVRFRENDTSQVGFSSLKVARKRLKEAALDRL
jgi:hypothetical protein